MATTDVSNVINTLKSTLFCDNVRMRIQEDPKYTQGASFIHAPAIGEAFKDIPSPLSLFDKQLTRTIVNVTAPRKQEEKFYGNMIDLLVHVYPEASLLMGQSLIDKFDSFKQELSQNLTNINQLGKKFGFTRRKGFDMIGFQAQINSMPHTLEIDEKNHNIIEYLAKLLKTKIVALPSSDVLARFDFDPIEYVDTSKVFLLTKESTKLLCSEVVMNQLLQHPKIKEIDIGKAGIQTLREACKYLGLYEKSMAKADMVAKLRQISLHTV